VGINTSNNGYCFCEHGVSRWSFLILIRISSLKYFILSREDVIYSVIKLIYLAKKMESYKITKKCKSCKDGTILTGEGNSLPCPYCKGTRKRTFEAVHPSHRMTKKRCEIIAPCGTPRFYSVRNCKKCGKEEWEHAAGHFLHGLDYPCEGKQDGT